MPWSFLRLGICNQFQVPLTIALNWQQIIQGTIHLHRVKIILVHLFLPPQPPLACPRFCRC